MAPRFDPRKKCPPGTVPRPNPPRCVPVSPFPTAVPGTFVPGGTVVRGGRAGWGHVPVFELGGRLLLGKHSRFRNSRRSIRSA